MEYTIYKFKFRSGVHFGENSLENSTYSFHADTLFSALCHEAVKHGKEALEKLVEYIKSGKLLLSDAFPYIEDTYYIPKPMKQIQMSEDKKGDSKLKKMYKKLRYIPLKDLDGYLKGAGITDEAGRLDELGKTEMRVMASIRGEKEAVPYRTETYFFNQGNGLYVIVGYEDNEAGEYLEKLLCSLETDGIGGKRTAGLGRFEIHKHKLPDELLKHINQKGRMYMTLSVSLPKDDELEQAVNNAQYKLIKRSGFVASDKYADEYMRKRDLYVFDSGACFVNKFEGDIYDVSCGGKHAVYRYAKALWLGVD